MNNYVIHIKNMVCPRCIKAVETTMLNNDIGYTDVRLGEVELNKPLTSQEENILSENLLSQGFELLADKKGQLIEKIKNTIIQIVHYQDDPHKIGHLRQQLPKLLGHSYS